MRLLLLYNGYVITSNDLLLLLLLLATMTLNQVQSFRINHQVGSYYINI